MIDKKIKVYEFAECDYIVATNLRQAIRCWISYCDDSIRDALESFKIIDRPMWKKYQFVYDELHTRKTTFEKRIKEVLDTKEETVPFFLASSEY
jgi:hypothetical protein